MSELNIVNAKLNIIAEMDKRNYKQKDIMRITGMPQANVSRALDTENKKMFTIDQLYKLADDFDVSIDELLGRNNKSVNAAPSLEEISSFLVNLFETGHLRHCKHTVKETVPEDTMVYIPEYDREEPSIDYVEKDFEYDALYFSNSRSPVRTYKINSDDDHSGSLYDNQEINIFLAHYLKIFDLYKDGILPKDAYDFVVKGYLENFKKYTNSTQNFEGSPFHYYDSF